MYRGRILGIVGPDTPREEIGLLMAGISPDAAAATGRRPQPTSRGRRHGRPARERHGRDEDEA